MRCVPRMRGPHPRWCRELWLSSVLGEWMAELATVKLKFWLFDCGMSTANHHEIGCAAVHFQGGCSEPGMKLAHGELPRLEDHCWEELIRCERADPNFYVTSFWFACMLRMPQMLCECHVAFWSWWSHNLQTYEYCTFRCPFQSIVVFLMQFRQRWRYGKAAKYFSCTCKACRCDETACCYVIFVSIRAFIQHLRSSNNALSFTDITLFSNQMKS